MAKILGIMTQSLLLLMVLTLAGEASEIYRWVDASGQIHFTDNYGSVPPEYRGRVQRQHSAPPVEAPDPPPSASRSPQSRREKTPPYPSPPNGRLAKVVAVVDGDTIVISGGKKVRYAGLNTPESNHPDKLPEYCGREAFEANRRLVAGKTVRLEFDQRRRDKYGRLLAYVHVDHLFVNAELIRQGYAQVSTYKENRRHHEEFQRLQQSAIAARRGLWGGCIDLRMPPVSTTAKPPAAQRDRKHAGSR